MTPRLLGIGDPHIKPANTAIDYDHLSIPPDVDAIVTNGDVIHRPDPGDIDTGREFFERLNESGKSILAIPGNHDPAEYYDRLLAGAPNARLLHDTSVTSEDFDVGEAEPLGGHAVVGWGCESLQFAPEIPYREFPALDPRDRMDHTNRRYIADEFASELETEMETFATGDRTIRDLTDQFGIGHDNRQRFVDSCRQFRDRYEQLTELLTTPDRPTIMVSHIPPFNTKIDRHHSTHGTSDEDLHIGSLSLKIAMRHHPPIVAISGHSHTQAYDSFGTESERLVHLVGVGFRGVGLIDVDGHSGSFGIDFLTGS